MMQQERGWTEAERAAAVGGGPPLPVAAPPAPASDAPRLTLSNYEMFHPRVKKLPPDANAEAAINAKLLQFPLHLSFYCVKCRRDNIVSDCVAVDSVNRVMLCTRCFTRIIRPRTYKPSRVVPFPSLLSWLNYQPAKVMTEVAEDILNRPAEAVAPSGERIAGALTGSQGGGTLLSLPPSAANVVPVTRQQGRMVRSGMPLTEQDMGAEDLRGTHPCERVWRHCAHGETCLFRTAPRDLCLAHLMGLCSGSSSSCTLLHQKVFDLPNAEDAVPHPIALMDLNEGSGSDLRKWIERRMKSPNRAEWQLWHNGSVASLIKAYVPIRSQDVHPPQQSSVAVKRERSPNDDEVSGAREDSAPLRAPAREIAEQDGAGCSTNDSSRPARYARLGADDDEGTGGYDEGDDRDAALFEGEDEGHNPTAGDASAIPHPANTNEGEHALLEESSPSVPQAAAAKSDGQDTARGPLKFNLADITSVLRGLK